MSRSLTRYQALFLGFIVFVGVSLAGVGLFAVGSRGWFGANALGVRVGFPEIRGVEIGTRVRIQGIDSGEVVAIEPPSTPDSAVMLRIRIKGEYRHLVRKGSTVQIVSEGMLGAKVLEVRPPRSAAKELTNPAAEDDVLASEASVELNDVLHQVGTALNGLQAGQGSLGKLVKDPQAYDALVSLLRSGKDAVEKSKTTLTSIQRDADAIKRLPIIRRYVEDPMAILVRPGSERNRRVFAESELFEPGRAVLTSSGRAKLNELSPWLNGLKHKGSDVVVVSYADPKSLEDNLATSITQQQSEAVITYLRENQKVHKLGWFTSRKVVGLGMGTQMPPQAEREPLPSSRVEIVVFVPQG